MATPAQLRSRLDLRGRHERFLAEIGAFACSTGQDQPRVLCAWCSPKGRETVIRDGNPELPASHGLCPDCEAEFDAQPGGPLADGPQSEEPVEVSMSTEDAASRRQNQRMEAPQ